MADGRPRLPPLPAEYEARFGEVHALVKAQHEKPLPTMQEPFATPAEHQRWVDEVLIPWQDAQTPAGIAINATREEHPDLDATPNEEYAFSRAYFVRGALSVALMTNRRIVELDVRMPRSMLEDASKREGAIEYMAFILVQNRKNITFYRDLCTYRTYRDERPTLPADLVPWQTFCRLQLAQFMDHYCAAEHRLHPGTMSDECSERGAIE